MRDSHSSRVLDFGVVNVRSRSHSLTENQDRNHRYLRGNKIIQTDSNLLKDLSHSMKKIKDFYYEDNPKEISRVENKNTEDNNHHKNQKQVKKNQFNISDTQKERLDFSSSRRNSSNRAKNKIEKNAKLSYLNYQYRSQSKSNLSKNSVYLSKSNSFLSSQKSRSKSKIQEKGPVLYFKPQQQKNNKETPSSFQLNNSARIRTYLNLEGTRNQFENHAARVEYYESNLSQSLDKYSKNKYITTPQEYNKGTHVGVSQSIVNKKNIDIDQEKRLSSHHKKQGAYNYRLTYHLKAGEQTKNSYSNFKKDNFNNKIHIVPKIGKEFLNKSKKSNFSQSFQVSNRDTDSVNSSYDQIKNTRNILPQSKYNKSTR